MAKQKQGNGKLSTIVLIFLFLVFIGTMACGVMLYKENNNLDGISLSLDKIYEEYVERKNDSNEEIQKIEKEIEELNKIDEKILNEKKLYFENIKKLEDKIIAGESDKKIAYLTFDDGPYNLTYKYLEVLNKYNVKATFFTIGAGKERCLDKKDISCYPVYKAIVENGHTIANHTFSHGIRTGLYSSSESFITQVKKQEELIKEQTGVITNIVRFPGGSVTAKGYKNEIIEKLREINYGWVDWTALDGDGGALSSKEQAITTFKNSINQNIEVVLLHDYNQITLDILPEIIEYLQDNGYILLPLFYESNMINK